MWGNRYNNPYGGGSMYNGGGMYTGGMGMRRGGMARGGAFGHMFMTVTVVLVIIALAVAGLKVYGNIKNADTRSGAYNVQNLPSSGNAQLGQHNVWSFLPAGFTGGEQMQYMQAYTTQPEVAKEQKTTSNRFLKVIGAIVLLYIVIKILKLIIAKKGDDEDDSKSKRISLMDGVIGVRTIRSRAVRTAKKAYIDFNDGVDAAVAKEKAEADETDKKFRERVERNNARREEKKASRKKVKEGVSHESSGSEELHEEKKARAEASYKSSGSGDYRERLQQLFAAQGFDKGSFSETRRWYVTTYMGCKPSDVSDEEIVDHLENS